MRSRPYSTFVDDQLELILISEMQKTRGRDVVCVICVPVLKNVVYCTMDV